MGLGTLGLLVAAATAPLYFSALGIPEWTTTAIACVIACACLCHVSAVYASAVLRQRAGNPTEGVDTWVPVPLRLLSSVTVSITSLQLWLLVLSQG